MGVFWVRQHTTNNSERLRQALHAPRSSDVAPYPKDNRLVIPALMLNTAINEGRDISALKDATWRRPGGSAPDKGGNTVIVAHRFTYTDPEGTFYYLHKLAKGDEVGIFWEGKRYIYKVAAVRVVSPRETSVEDATEKPQLTLYTCTPLWLPKDRLVVTATLESAL